MSSDDINIDYYFNNNSKYLKFKSDTRFFKHYHSQRLLSQIKSSSKCEESKNFQQQQPQDLIINSSFKKYSQILTTRPSPSFISSRYLFLSYENAAAGGNVKKSRGLNKSSRNESTFNYKSSLKENLKLKVISKPKIKPTTLHLSTRIIPSTNKSTTSLSLLNRPINKKSHKLTNNSNNCRYSTNSSSSLSSSFCENKKLSKYKIYHSNGSLEKSNQTPNYEHKSKDHEIIYGNDKSPKLSISFKSIKQSSSAYSQKLCNSNKKFKDSQSCYGPTLVINKKTTSLRRNSGGSSTSGVNSSCKSDPLYHSSSNLYVKSGLNSSNSIKNMNSSPSRHNNNTNVQQHHHQSEGFHHIGGRLSIHPIDRYDESITCCSLPPPSPAPTSDRFVIAGIPTPASSSSISCGTSLSFNNHHHHHHHYATGSEQVQNVRGSIVNTEKYTTMHRTISPSSRYRISSTDRYHRDLSPKCTPVSSSLTSSSQQQQQQHQQSSGNNHLHHDHHQSSGGVTNSDRFNITTTAHFLTNSTPLVSSDAYAYLSSTVHTPVKRYVPTPPPPTEIYSDIPISNTGIISNDCTVGGNSALQFGNHQSSLSLPQTHHSQQQHISTLPYRFRMKCCLTEASPAQQQQQSQSMSVSCPSNRTNSNNYSVADHYATPPRVRPLKCSSNSNESNQQSSKQHQKLQQSSNTTPVNAAANSCTNTNCNANATIHGRQSRTGSITSQCIINDYVQRTPSNEYLVGNINSNSNSNSSRNVVTPVSVMAEPLTNATCLHCNTMRRTTGVHQTTQTTGPISPVPQQAPQLPLQQNYSSLNSNNIHNESTIANECIATSPIPSLNQHHLSPLSSKQQQQQLIQQQSQQLIHQQASEQQIICRAQQQQQQQKHQQQQQQQQQQANLISQQQNSSLIHSSLGRNVQHQHQVQTQSQSTISQLAVALGPSQSQIPANNLSNQIVRQQQQQHQIQQQQQQHQIQQQQQQQHHHHLVASSNNLQSEMMANITIGSANNLLSSTNTPQRNTLTIRQQMQQRFSRKQRLKEYIRKEIAQFFGVDLHSEDEERYKWQERQKRFAVRRLGPLKSDSELNCGNGSFGDGRRDVPPPGDRPDILPVQITSEESQISNFEDDLRLPIAKKSSVPTMFMSAILYIIQTLHKREPRASKQWSRSFAPAHVTPLIDSSSDLCEGQSILQDDEVFFDSPVNEVCSAGSLNGNNAIGVQNPNGRQGSSSKLMEHSRQLYMGERVHGWRTFAIIDQQQTDGCVNRNSSLNGSHQQRLGYRGTRISCQILDGILENSRRPIARKVKIFHPNELDDRNDHRPFFTYWVNTVQTLVLILSLICYGVGPIGFGIEQKTGQVLVTSLSLQTVQHQEQRNLWIGPRNHDLVHLGAKFAACMRRDIKIMEVVAKIRRQERETACCIRNDDSGCVQSSQADCSVRGLWPTKSISTWKKWSPEFSGPGGRISGSVCGLDPKYCDTPASIAPYEWPDDITKWPICRKTNSFSQRFRYKGQIAEHMVCEVIGHPCCTGLFGECSITTREYCDFVNGYFHEEASLCSQVSCLSNVCGMLPFLSIDVPDQFYRFFTSLCLHAGIMHLGITIAFQHVFLADLERLIGPIRTAIVYIGSGLAGNLTSAILVPYKPEVGPLASIAGVISSIVVLLLLAHWRQLKKPHLALIKLIVVVGTIFGLGTLPWQQNFAGLIAGVFCGVYLTVALVPFISITKYGRKAKINLIWTCVLFHIFIYTIMFVIFYVFPTELTSIDFGDIINGNGFNTHSTINHKNRFDIDNYGSNMNSPHNHNNHHHHTDVIDDRGSDDRVMSAGTVNEIKTNLINLNKMQTKYYNAAILSNNFHNINSNNYRNNNNYDNYDISVINKKIINNKKLTNNIFQHAYNNRIDNYNYEINNKTYIPNKDYVNESLFLNYTKILNKNTLLVHKMNNINKTKSNENEKTHLIFNDNVKTQGKNIIESVQQNTLDIRDDNQNIINFNNKKVIAKNYKNNNNHNIIIGNAIELLDNHLIAVNSEVLTNNEINNNNIDKNQIIGHEILNDKITINFHLNDVTKKKKISK